MNLKFITSVVFILLLPEVYSSGGNELPVAGVPGDRSIIVYTINNNSWLTLSGTTNVNAFECRSGGAKTTGNLTVEAVFYDDRIALSDAVILVDISSFDCRNPLINRDMQRAMGGDNGSVIEIRVVEVGLHQDMENKDNGKITVNTCITINGITNRKELDVRWSREHDTGFRFEGSADLLMSRFGIDPPSPALGLVKVDDRIKIDFNYIVRPDMISGLD